MKLQYLGQRAYIILEALGLKIPGRAARHNGEEEVAEHISAIFVSDHVSTVQGSSAMKTHKKPMDAVDPEFLMLCAKSPIDTLSTIVPLLDLRPRMPSCLRSEVAFLLL